MKRSLSLVAIVAAIFLTSTRAHAMGWDVFLSIEGVKGESRVDGHKDQIEILSFSWGETNTAGAAGGGGGAGKVQMSPLALGKTTDKSSPVLFKACASGKHYPEATLVVVRRSSSDEGRQQEQPYMKFVLSDVTVTSYQVGGAGGEQPTESLSLNFTKISYSYSPQSDNGEVGSPVTAAWDLKLNK